MQLYAFEKDLLILATLAKRHKDYLCPECKAPVRLRKGPHKQAHFYHLKASGCSLHGKSLMHLQAQIKIHSLFPREEVQMERAFPEIARIADVAWEKEKIVFEVQCSPISLAEAEERCSDYKKIGYTPFWLLHDKRYNKLKIKVSEDFLRRKIGCYFTNIDAQGQGVFYDQWDQCKNSYRQARSAPLTVDLSRPSANLYRPNWPLSFLGDLSTHSTLAHALEKRFSSQPLSLKKRLFYLYQNFFRFLLEKFC